MGWWERGVYGESGLRQLYSVVVQGVQEGASTSHRKTSLVTAHARVHPTHPTLGKRRCEHARRAEHPASTRVVQPQRTRESERRCTAHSVKDLGYAV
jgi:hypothetical protein